MSVFGLSQAVWRDITLLAAQLRRVHSFAKNLHRQLTSLLQITILLIILFQQALRTRIIRANARRFPAAVVAARVALVQLELSLRVVAGIDEGDTERPQTTVLRVPLLQIT